MQNENSNTQLPILHKDPVSDIYIRNLMQVQVQNSSIVREKKPQNATLITATAANHSFGTMGDGIQQYVMEAVYASQFHKEIKIFEAELAKAAKVYIDAGEGRSYPVVTSATCVQAPRDVPFDFVLNVVPPCFKKDMKHTYCSDNHNIFTPVRRGKNELVDRVAKLLHGDPTEQEKLFYKKENTLLNALVEKEVTQKEVKKEVTQKAKDQIILNKTYINAFKAVAEYARNHSDENVLLDMPVFSAGAFAGPYALKDPKDSKKGGNEMIVGMSFEAFQKALSTIPLPSNVRIQWVEHNPNLSKILSAKLEGEQKIHGSSYKSFEEKLILEAPTDFVPLPQTPTEKLEEENVSTSTLVENSDQKNNLPPRRTNVVKPQLHPRYIKHTGKSQTEHGTSATGKAPTLPEMLEKAKTWDIPLIETKTVKLEPAELGSFELKIPTTGAAELPDVQEDLNAVDSVILSENEKTISEILSAPITPLPQTPLTPEAIDLIKEIERNKLRALSQKNDDPQGPSEVTHANLDQDLDDLISDLGKLEPVLPPTNTSKESSSTTKRRVLQRTYATKRLDAESKMQHEGQLLEQPAEVLPEPSDPDIFDQLTAIDDEIDALLQDFPQGPSEVTHANLDQHKESSSAKEKPILKRTDATKHLDAKSKMQHAVLEQPKEVLPEPTKNNPESPVANTKPNDETRDKKPLTRVNAKRNDIAKSTPQSPDNSTEEKIVIDVIDFPGEVRLKRSPHKQAAHDVKKCAEKFSDWFSKKTGHDSHKNNRSR